MRFLCLHGYGTCADVLKEMMEPITEHLPGNWEYEYMEAGMECSKLLLFDLDQLPSPNYGWYNFPEPDDMRAALERLSSFIEAEGPFDGLWGFSQGASLAALYLLEYQKANPGCTEWPFKMVIFNSTFLPYRIDAGAVTWSRGEKDQIEGVYEPGEVDMRMGKTVDWTQNERTVLDYLLIKRTQDNAPLPLQTLPKYMPVDVTDKINLPSVHVRGVKDHLFFVDDRMSELFDPDFSKKMTHRGGHHFPRFPDELVQFAELIIDTAASIL